MHNSRPENKLSSKLVCCRAVPDSWLFQWVFTKVVTICAEMFTSPNFFFFFFYWTKIGISIALFALRTGLLRQVMTHRCIFLLSWIVISPLTPFNLFIWKKKTKHHNQPNKTATSASKSTKNANYCKSIGSLNLQSCCYTVTTVVLVLQFSGQTLRQHEPKENSFSFLALLGNTAFQFRFSSADGKVWMHPWGCMDIAHCSFSYYWTVWRLLGYFTLEIPPFHHCYRIWIFCLSNE